jgi:DNA mismatch endonuclease (patch repair protein)
MRSVRAAGTQPEAMLSRLLQDASIEHDPQVKLGSVRVDVVLRAARVAVFVDGCFWHGCPRHGSIPASNASYWEDKIRRNRRRDRRNSDMLRREGWAVVRLWEHTVVRKPRHALGAVLRGMRRAGRVAGGHPLTPKIRQGFRPAEEQ